MLGLGAHLVHQPGTLDHIGKARIVFDIRRNGELAAWLDARDQNGRQHGARGIDGGGITSRTRSNNGTANRAGIGHGTDSRQGARR